MIILKWPIQKQNVKFSESKLYEFAYLIYKFKVDRHYIINTNMSLVRVSMLWNSQKKRNYRLEDRLVRVLYAAEIELPKIIKP